LRVLQGPRRRLSLTGAAPDLVAHRVGGPAHTSASKAAKIGLNIAYFVPTWFASDSRPWSGRIAPFAWPDQGLFVFHSHPSRRCPVRRRVAPVPHQLFIICRARFRRRFNEMPAPTSLARRNRIARWPLLTLMVGVRWLRLRRLFTSAKTRPTNRLQALLPIAAKEGKLLDEPSGGGHATADRKWLLDTYAECLRTVQNPSNRSDRSE
jgi:hypothetical protein